MDINIDVSKNPIETERLILREWRQTDLADFFEYASVDGVGEMAGWNHHRSIEESERILSSFIAEKNVYAVVSKRDGKVIGSLGLHKSWANEESEYADLKVKEIGYVLSKDYWGNGLMTEAVHAVIRLCFDVIMLDALTIGHFIANNRSKRVIEKCGFTFVKFSEFYAKQMDKTFEDIKYILIK